MRSHEGAAAVRGRVQNRVPWVPGPMRTDSQRTAPAVAADAVTAGLLPFLLGLVLVAVLVGAVWLGIRIRSREPAPPRPEDQPRPPASGPVPHVTEEREPAEVPRGRGRLTPHELPGHGNSGTRPARRPARRRGERQSGGSRGPGA
ncbi:DUF6479 family protein [Streptomyces sp. MAR4 CNX-425]|uniref:DUF6479 family protein n=1 Tax=Streptomyces sp. MAR4 CNX-425 TaxID=3406343 RepID=UPI003B50C069